MIDFEIPEDTKAIRAKVREFVQNECIPAEADCTAENFDQVLAGLREKARSQGLWCPFIPEEHGGMGLRPLANALVQMELGESFLGATVPEHPGARRRHHADSAGTRHRSPEREVSAAAAGWQQTHLLFDDGKGRRRRRHRHADQRRTGRRQLGAERRKVVQLIRQRCRHRGGDGENRPRCAAPSAVQHLHRRIAEPRLSDSAQHRNDAAAYRSGAEAWRRPLRGEIDNLEIPRENLLGGRGNGFNMGQHRLAYGRLRHGMHNVAMAQRALDLAAEHVTSRETFGKRLADRQGVRWMLADCAAEIYKARLMLLHIAYKAENGLDLRQENGIAKVFLANMVHQVVDTSLQLHGALGYSMDTPLARWYRGIRSQRLVDGPDEVHRWRTGANVIKAYEKYGTTASACGGELL